MQQEWSFNFGPGFVSPEELREREEKQKEELRRNIDEKKCAMCLNVSFVNDQIAICNAKNSTRAGTCVDELDGKSCEYWLPISII